MTGIVRLVFCWYAANPGEVAADPPAAGTELGDGALVELVSRASQRLFSCSSW
jgi:hypothetical protein